MAGEVELSNGCGTWRLSQRDVNRVIKWRPDKGGISELAQLTSSFHGDPQGH